MMMDVMNRVHVIVHRWRDRPGYQWRRQGRFDDRRRRPGDALLRFLLLLMSLRRFTQILRLCAQVLWLGDIVHHDIDNLFFNYFRNFFGWQDMHWPLFQRTVAVIVVLLREAPRCFFDQHFDHFLFISALLEGLRRQFAGTGHCEAVSPRY